MSPRKLDTIKKAAFNITAAFEGGGYASYQNYDSGIISYGRFQFTLASGSLFTVLEQYLAHATGSTADTLRTQYLHRVHDKDATLRHDGTLKTLLIKAADDPAMQAAQDALATTKYWDLVQNLSIKPRNIQTPLGIALVFDMAINHGARHDMIGLAEEAIGVPPKSKMPANGGDERELIKQIALIRRDRMHRLADKRGLEGLRQRGDFWVDLVASGDWDLTGDTKGLITVKPGRSVQVLFPGEVGAPAKPAPVKAPVTEDKTLDQPATEPVPPKPVAPPTTEVASPPVKADPARVKKAAFNITTAFEGGGYATYQNYDTGIISYGRFQFTLASGSLFTVLEQYLAHATGSTADTLRTQYLHRVHDKDATLRDDGTLKTLLIKAADDPAMQAAQDALATTKYWELVQNLSIKPRNIQTPLGIALVFDMAINHGARHDMIGLAEKAIGVPPKSKMPENGGDEHELIKQVALIRRDRMHRLADKRGLEGLRQRGDFWVDLVESGDWDLAGDTKGLITVKPGRSVRVLFPGVVETPAKPAPPKPADPATTEEALPPVKEDPVRVKKAAFNITAAFEGGGYASYQNYDSGIISYGRFQFTLASGSLFTVLEQYLAHATGSTADALRTQYLRRVHDKDVTLRGDGTLKMLLVTAADDPAMQAAQDALATTKYWELVQNLSIKPRNIQTPLGIALVFDMAINHGARHDMIGMAEKAIGVPPKSKMPENGGDEHELIKQIALIRQDRMHRLADKRGLEGLRQRGDFWVDLVASGDWDLAGDTKGQITVKRGRSVQVKAP